MRLLIIRHGDPDYKNDSLTEQGWREAEMLAEMLAKKFEENEAIPQGVSDAGAEAARSETFFYVSPYGRARDTASLTLKKLGRTAEVMPWLREFDVFIDRPDDPDKVRIPWDWLPQDWTADPKFYEKDHWFENERMAASKVWDEYRKVTGELDNLLAKHGYRREGGYYRAERPNKDTIVLFCHFGVSSVLLSHLWNVSPMVVWHGFCAAPTSVTTVVTEERRKGIASFRMLAYGNTSHLYVNGESPSFSARFCECYDDDTRHD